MLIDRTFQRKGIVEGQTNRAKSLTSATRRTATRLRWRPTARNSFFEVCRIGIGERRCLRWTTCCCCRRRRLSCSRAPRCRIWVSRIHRLPRRSGLCTREGSFGSVRDLRSIRERCRCRNLRSTDEITIPTVAKLPIFAASVVAWTAVVSTNVATVDDPFPPVKSQIVRMRIKNGVTKINVLTMCFRSEDSTSRIDTWIGIILSFGVPPALGLVSGSKLELRLACGTAAATGNATSERCVRSFCGWNASILASSSDLKANGASDLEGFTLVREISALLVFRGLGRVALFKVISILLDIFGSSGSSLLSSSLSEI